MRCRSVCHSAVGCGSVSTSAIFRSARWPDTQTTAVSRLPRRRRISAKALQKFLARLLGAIRSMRSLPSQLWRMLRDVGIIFNDNELDSADAHARRFLLPIVVYHLDPLVHGDSRSLVLLAHPGIAIDGRRQNDRRATLSPPCCGGRISAAFFTGPPVGSWLATPWTNCFLPGVF